MEMPTRAQEKEGAAVNDVLAFDQAGPVAILVLVLLGLAKVAHWLLTKLIADKDAQIVKLSGTVDELTDGIGATLDAILTAVKEAAAERRREP